MLGAWRKECLCILAAGLVLLVVGLAVGRTQLALGAGLAAYVGWHVFNLILLQRWVATGNRFYLPVSVGVWEEIFDGLQRRQLRNRRRGSGLVRHLRQARDAGDQLPDALVLLDEDNTVLWFNAAAGKLLSLARTRDLGRNVTDLIPHPALQDALTWAESGRPLEIPSPASGAWILSMQATGAIDDSRRRLLVARDITPFHSIEEVRRNFIANVSHELRTPITVFRGYLGALRGGSARTEWEAPLRSMEEQAKRMQDLVEDLLLLSRLEMTRSVRSADLVPVSVALEAIVDQARVLSGTKAHKLTLQADPTVYLRGDEDELHSAFSNLVFNAVRHTPPGTSISVAWEGNPDRACLTVRDTGPGIAARHLPRLTERFYRVDSGRSRQDGGTGLGLAIARQVLERHDAELRISSEPGQGSVFSCHFPGTLVEVREEQHPMHEKRLRLVSPEPKSI